MTASINKPSNIIVSSSSAGALISSPAAGTYISITSQQLKTIIDFYRANFRPDIDRAQVRELGRKAVEAALGPREPQPIVIKELKINTTAPNIEAVKLTIELVKPGFEGTLLAIACTSRGEIRKCAILAYQEQIKLKKRSYGRRKYNPEIRGTA